MVQKTASSRMATRKRKFTNNDDKAEAFSSPSSPAAAAAAGDQPRKRYMGVRQSPSGRWVAEIKGTAQKIRLWLGTFDTAEQAAHAYDEAACLLRGANTRTNFWPRSSGCSGRPPHAASSILPAKVFNHLLRHIETQRAAQFDNQAETEHINRTAYSDPLLSDVSISSATQSNGEENEFSMSYCNTESDCVGGRQKGKEEEVDKGVDFAGLHLRSKEEFLSFDAPFEMSMVMEEARRKEEMGAYEYWLMLSYAAKNV